MLRKEAIGLVILSLLSFSLNVYYWDLTKELTHSNDVVFEALMDQYVTSNDLRSEVDILNAVLDDYEADFESQSEDDGIMYGQDYIIETWGDEVHFVGRSGWTEFTIEPDGYGGWMIDPWMNNTFISEDGRYLINSDSFYDDVFSVTHTGITHPFYGVTVSEYFMPSELRSLIFTW